MNLIEKIRTRITLGEREAINVTSSDFPGSYPGYDDRWSLKKFKKNFRVDIISIKDDTIEFDLIGIDAAIANAFRRILLAEVPSMAIDKILIENNTSVVFDEMLAHRLGLIPIKADPRIFEYRSAEGKKTAEDTIQFNLNIKCTHNPNAPKNATDPKELYINSTVYSRDLQWVPISSQSAIVMPSKVWLNTVRCCNHSLAACPSYNLSVQYRWMYYPRGMKAWPKENAPRPVDGDIIIAKLRPLQEIVLETHCVKGIGKDHAKFSPVATAFYRQLPEVILKQRVSGEAAHRLQASFSPGVIEIDVEDGEEVARVANSRLDTLSRNYLKHEDLKDCIEINLVRDHFIFSVESTGALPPQNLVMEAIGVLMSKCKSLCQEIDDLES